jgi:serine phosphatase RsbU (regulator of sigma subunit)
MSHVDFETVLHQQPTLAYEVMRELSRRLRDTDNATIRDLQEKNLQLAQAYQELQAAQAQIIEKEKIEQELQVARRIQESILPRTLPRRRGFDFGARMVPARAVGGDFFDFISFDSHTVGISIGDVSDKGVPAAIFMALTRSLLRAEAHRLDSPAQVLRRVNQHLLDMNEAGMFVTVLYGVLNQTTREFTYARAGHEIPLLFDPHGEVIPLEWGLGQPLGVLDQPALDERQITLPPSSTFLMHTDGATDALNEQGDSFGYDPLQTVVCAHLGEPAQAVCDRVIEAILDYQGASPQQDDVTLVGVCIQGEGQEQA